MIIANLTRAALRVGHVHFCQANRLAFFRHSETNVASLDNGHVSPPSWPP